MFIFFCLGCFSALCFSGCSPVSEDYLSRNIGAVLADHTGSYYDSEGIKRSYYPPFTLGETEIDFDDIDHSNEGTEEERILVRNAGITLPASMGSVKILCRELDFSRADESVTCACGSTRDPNTFTFLLCGQTFRPDYLTFGHEGLTISGGPLWISHGPGDFDSGRLGFEIYVDYDGGNPRWNIGREEGSTWTTVPFMGGWTLQADAYRLEYNEGSPEIVFSDCWLWSPSSTGYTNIVELLEEVRYSTVDEVYLFDELTAPTDSWFSYGNNTMSADSLTVKRDESVTLKGTVKRDCDGSPAFLHDVAASDASIVFDLDGMIKEYNATFSGLSGAVCEKVPELILTDGTADASIDVFGIVYLSVSGGLEYDGKKLVIDRFIYNCTGVDILELTAHDAETGDQYDFTSSVSNLAGDGAVG